MTFERLSRRTVLRGLGTAMALPWLEAMGPRLAFAADPVPAASPLRMAFVYVPNGIHMADWTPSKVGSDFELPRTLASLEAVKSELCVMTGLTHRKAEANGDGGGDHARALATFLTGRQAKKTDGADIRAGVSVDQLAAAHLGRQTRFPSLEIGVDQGAQSGNCDSGYSCAYSSNISWKSERQPVPKENNPRQIFERLFTNGGRDETQAARAKRERYNKSILDLVQDDARRLHQQLGSNDQRKLDEYLTAVREVELRIEASGRPVPPAPGGFARPAGIPKTNEEHIALLYQLLALSFQGDVTRVATYVIANEGSNKNYPFLGIPEGHHELSHHANDKAKQDKLQKINTFHVAQFAKFLEQLHAIREGEDSLLDQCMIVYGSGIGDGNAHNHDDLPILLAGRGGRSVDTGRHIQYENGTPLTNLYLSMLDRVGTEVSSLGDSSGRLDNLTV